MKLSTRGRVPEKLDQLPQLPTRRSACGPTLGVSPDRWHHQQPLAGRGSLMTAIPVARGGTEISAGAPGLPDPICFPMGASDRPRSISVTPSEERRSAIPSRRSRSRGRPEALDRPCSTPGGQGTGQPHCETCRSEGRSLRVGRASAIARGYDARWRGISKTHPRRYPLCGDRDPRIPETGDSLCRSQGRISPANQCDRVTPWRGNETLRRAKLNRQSLCGRCHQHKTARERAGRERGGGVRCSEV